MQAMSGSFPASVSVGEHLSCQRWRKDKSDWRKECSSAVRKPSGRLSKKASIWDCADR